ncbi:STY4851/ECs_5259 family protein [Pseudoxanthomonas beigongshangi]
MVGEINEGWKTLLASRGIDRPDGRPLYAYKFSRPEFDRVGGILRRNSDAILEDLNAPVLVLAYVAEWFRRERAGGHWDWIRPLHSIGLTYGPNALVRYADIESLVDRGLAGWRRPKPKEGERLLSVVREAGFPAASVREDPRIASWLKHAVLAAERGLEVGDSIKAEAWRVSERLAQALGEPASDLCARIVDLRAKLSREAMCDPVGALNQIAPGWREELPFDIESDDIRAMIEQIVGVREGTSVALGIKRYLTRVDDQWMPRAAISLAGDLDSRRLPSVVNTAIKDGRRIRIAPLPPFCDQRIAVAAIESCERDGQEAIVLRALVSQFDAPLCMSNEAKFVTLIGNASSVDFIAPGGEAIDALVIAMHVERMDDSGSPIALRVIGPSPVKTHRSILALAVHDDTLGRLAFSSGYSKLGQCALSGRVIVSFNGTASYTQDGGTWNWRTAADEDNEGAPILVGNLLRGSHESVYCGFPAVWVERNGLVRQAREHEIHWRPWGRGRWRRLHDGKPWGKIDIALINGGQVQCCVAASVVPPKFAHNLDRGARELHVSGSASRKITAAGAHNLDVRREGDVDIVELGPPACAPKVTLGLRWDAELELSFTDPSYELRLLDASDTILPPHSTLAVDDLKGVRLCATTRTVVALELHANDAPRLAVTYTIIGDAPLSMFGHSIKKLLGGSEKLDAYVEVSAVGGTERIAKVRWYAKEVDPFGVSSTSPFSVLAATRGMKLHGMSLAQPSAGIADVVGPASIDKIRDELARSLPKGPWLVHGFDRNGSRIRPRIVPAFPNKSAITSTFEDVVAIEDSCDRTRAMSAIYADPTGLEAGERRALIDLILLMRREDLPLAAIDALRLITQAPSLATRLLVDCQNMEERRALLDIQRDLPFLWCATSVGDWLYSFSDRIAKVKAALAGHDIDTSIICRRELAALAEIVSLRPELSAHANAVFLRVIVKHLIEDGHPIDATSVALPRIARGDCARRDVDRMVARHEEMGWPPSDVLASKHKDRYAEHWVSYDRSLADVISVPYALADHATGREILNSKELTRCRDVWLYDAEYFEAIVPICLHAALQAGYKNNQGRT